MLALGGAQVLKGPPREALAWGGWLGPPPGATTASAPEHLCTLVPNLCVQPLWAGPLSAPRQEVGAVGRGDGERGLRKVDHRVHRAQGDEILSLIPLCPTSLGLSLGEEA